MIIFLVINAYSSYNRTQHDNIVNEGSLIQNIYDIFKMMALNNITSYCMIAALNITYTNTYNGDLILNLDAHISHMKIRNFGRLLYEYLCIWWKLYQYGLIQMTQIADKHFALLIEDLWQAENSLSAHWWLRVNLLYTDRSSINWSRESSNQTFAFSFFCFVRTYVRFRYFF